jgi:1-acyl-sn-glycerol-3-phosphate acyltransferase
MVLISAHLIIGLLILIGFRLGRIDSHQGRLGPVLVGWWYRRLTALLGLQIHTRGTLARRSLLVANHISWMDIPVIGSLDRVSFLSKAEVRQWPLIGWMAEQLGTLFIERGNHQAADLTQHISAQVREQQSVVIFAEGTTGDGHQLKRFYPRLLAAAQQPGIDVQPVALRYGNNTNPDPIAPFIGDDNLIAHLWRVLCQAQIQVEVHCLQVITGVGSDRRSLASECERRIADALGVQPPTALSRRPSRGNNPPEAPS